MNKSQTSSLSRRLGPVFAEIAAQARKPSMEEHKDEYRSRPLDERLQGSPAKAYKPTHGGYPG